MIIEKKLWLVHIYEQGRYVRTVNETFTEARAAEFCKSFNGGECLTVAKPHTLLAEVDEHV